MTERKRAKLLKRLNELSFAVNNLRNGVSLDLLREELEAREIELMDSMDRVSRLIDPEHTHYEDAT